MNTTPDDAEAAMNDPGGYYDMSGYAGQPAPLNCECRQIGGIGLMYTNGHPLCSKCNATGHDPGPKARNIFREQQLARMVNDSVVRGGPINAEPDFQSNTAYEGDQ